MKNFNIGDWVYLYNCQEPAVVVGIYEDEYIDYQVKMLEGVLTKSEKEFIDNENKIKEQAEEGDFALKSVSEEDIADWNKMIIIEKN